MFEVGKVYTIRMAFPSGPSSFTGALIDVDLPLVCVQFGDGQRIVNVNSPFFVSADRSDEETATATHQRHEANFLADASQSDAAPVDLRAAYDAHKDDAPASPGYPSPNSRG